MKGRGMGSSGGPKTLHSQRGVFWITFLWWLGASIVSALLARPKIENARPSGIDEFQAPTATEGRVVPVIVGKVKVSSPNVVWYGDLVTEAIRDKAGGFLGIGAKKFTKGYRYKIGVQMAVSRGPIDGHDRVWFGDKVIKSGESSGSVTLNDPNFFGGEDRGGGVNFTLAFHDGTTGQAVDSYLAQHQTPTPRYQNTAYFVLSDGAGGPGYIGNSAQLRQLSYELFWYPNSLAVTGGKERIGDDANPICFLYELLVTNTDWGIQFPNTDVLVSGSVAAGALRAVAEQVADEGLGFSGIFDRELEVREVIQEIERHVDGAFRLDLADGLFKIILARPPESTPPTLDESNIVELVSFSRGNWSETVNELRIAFTDRAKEYNQTYAFDYDLANRQITGRRSLSTLNFPYVKDAVTAQQLAARELPGFSIPQMRMSAKVDRSMYRLQRGDPFLWDWPDEGIVQLPMRVTRVGYGTDRQALITVDGVEDVYRLETTGFVAPPATGWEPPSFTAVAALDARIWEPPAQLAPVVYQPVLLVARNGGLHLDYDVYTDRNGGTDNFEATNEDVADWCPTASLNGAIDRDTGDVDPYVVNVVIDTVRDVTFGTLDEVASATVNSSDPANVLLIDDEVLFWETATDNLDGTFTLECHRGAFGTVPADHADNARVWFPGLGGGLVATTNASALATFRCRVVTRTASGELALASAPNIPSGADYTVAGQFGYSPGDVQVNGEKFVDEDGWTKTPATLRITWNPRSSTQPFGTKQTDTGVVSPGEVFHQVRVKRADTDAVVATAPNAPAGAYNASGFIPQSSPGVPAELDFYIEVQTRRLGVNGQLWLSRTFEVFGFGLDFGSDFGGQDTGGANLGFVLRQGDAPFIPEPIPGVNVLRTVRYTFGGSPTASDDFRVVFSFIGGPDGNYVPSPMTITGTTPEALAQDLYTTLSALIAGAAPAAPYVAITIAGTVVECSTYYGFVSGGYRSRAGQAYTRLVQQAKASGTSRQQTAFIDFWDSELILGEQTDVLAPSQGDEYDNNTQFQIGVSALTFDAAVALAPLNDGRPVTGRLFGPFSFGSPFVNPPHGAYANLQELATLMTTLGGQLNNFVLFGGGTNTDTPTTDNGNNVQMVRPGITILAQPEYQVGFTGPRGYQTAAADSATGYACLVKQIRGALVGRALEQIIEFSASREFNAGAGGGDNLTAGQIWRLTLGTTTLEYTITVGDVALEGAGSNYRDPVTEYFAANLPGGYTGTLVQSPRASIRSDGRTFFYSTLYIRRDATNTPFVFDASATYGATLKVENF